MSANCDPKSDMKLQDEGISPPIINKLRIYAKMRKNKKCSRYNNLRHYETRYTLVLTQQNQNTFYKYSNICPHRLQEGLSREKAPLCANPFHYHIEYVTNSFVRQLRHIHHCSDEERNVVLTVNEHSVVNILNEYDNNGMYVDNYLADEMNQRGLVRMIRIMSFGFIILISLISVTNVFNTISTNIMLRKRDFGMLRSVGMRNRDVYRMMVYECLLYGTQALLWGVPISIALSYGCYRIADIAYVTQFEVPILELLLAASIIFAVVAITMFYAVSKLRKDNPIDAIRMENT